MARNAEKHNGRLNRIWLQQLDEEKLKKNPSRPGLGSLNTASEVKKWIPSIKKDIDFYLKQSQVICYPERHIDGFSSKIESLTKEYKAYIRKLRELEPKAEAVPWTDRPYSRKHKTNQQEKMTGDKDEIKEVPAKLARVEKETFNAIPTPLLDSEDQYVDMYGYNSEVPLVIQNVNSDTKDLPLQFEWNKKVDKNTDKAIDEANDRDSSEVNDSGEDHTVDCEESLNSYSRKGKVHCPPDTSEINTGVGVGVTTHRHNLLYLPYSDSDSDSDVT